MKIFRSAVLPTLLYGSDSWCLLNSDVNAMEVFQMRCLREIAGVSLRQRLTNNYVRRMCLDQPTVATQIKTNRLRWLGHLLRMPANRIVRNSFVFPPNHQWKCVRDAPKQTWSKIVRSDIDYLKTT